MSNEHVEVFVDRDAIPGDDRGVTLVARVDISSITPEPDEHGRHCVTLRGAGRKASTAYVDAATAKALRAPPERPEPEATILPAPHGLYEYALQPDGAGFPTPMRALLASLRINTVTGVARLSNFFGDTPRYVVNEGGAIFNGLDGEEMSFDEFFARELRRLLDTKWRPPGWGMRYFCLSGTPTSGPAPGEKVVKADLPEGLAIVADWLRERGLTAPPNRQ